MEQEGGGVDWMQGGALIIGAVVACSKVSLILGRSIVLIQLSPSQVHRMSSGGTVQIRIRFS